jgi:hypothetical protein
MEHGAMLHLTCPRQRLVAPTFLCIAGMLVLSTAYRNSWPRIAAGEAYLFVAVSLLMMAFLLVILYRNFVYQDQLLIEHGALPVHGMGAICLDARDIVSVRLLPGTTVSAFESRMAWLGIGEGLIEIDTAIHRYRFGAGLDMYRAEAAVQQIATFCQAGITSPTPSPS